MIFKIKYNFVILEHIGQPYFDLKPQDSFGRFFNFFLDLQKVDHIIREHH